MKKILTEAFTWFLLVMATGFWFGFWQYIGKDTAMNLIIRLLEMVHN